MPSCRVNLFAVKLHRSYTAGELAERLGVHKNTVRHWRAAGLEPVGKGRPLLFHGEVVRAFLSQRNAARKRPCPPGTFYCFRCRAPRGPALNMVDYGETKPGTGNLKALCETCGAIMHRCARRVLLPTVMPGIAVQITEAPERLCKRPSPPLNCDSSGRGANP
jgi:hypothetical protein